jgi:hypothetical protein
LQLEEMLGIVHQLDEAGVASVALAEEAYMKALYSQMMRCEEMEVLTTAPPSMLGSAYHLMAAPSFSPTSTSRGGDAVKPLVEFIGVVAFTVLIDGIIKQSVVNGAY